MRNFITKTLAALALASASLAAIAGPVYNYKIDVDASDMADGYLDLQFTSMFGALPAEATVYGFTTGIVFSDLSLNAGTVTDLGGNAWKMGNDMSDLFLGVTGGEVFAFNVSFTGEGLMGPNDFQSAFVADMYSAGFDQHVRTLITFTPASDLAGASIDVGSDQGISTTDVPEPASLATLATGLILLGAVRRRASGKK